MDLFKELDVLPCYFYVIEDNFKLLGGRETRPNALTNFISFHDIYFLWKEMMNIYQNNCLTDDNKHSLAKSMYRMKISCEGRNMKKNELSDYISSLSEKQKTELEMQIKMYKDSRLYSFQYKSNLL